MELSIADLIVATAMAMWMAYLLRNYRASADLPPGPKFLPFVGTVRRLISKELWVLVRKWGKEYGGWSV